jgi:hypothetical protein
MADLTPDASPVPARPLSPAEVRYLRARFASEMMVLMVRDRVGSLNSRDGQIGNDGHNR